MKKANTSLAKEMAASRHHGQHQTSVLQELSEPVVASACLVRVPRCVASRRERLSRPRPTLRRETSRVPASARQSQNVPVSYPRSLEISPSQATSYAHLQGFSASPLTDSNRRPPPYHGGFAPLPFGCEKRLVARFPCNRAGFSACSTPSLTAPEPPRETPNLSPELAPPQAVCVGEDGNIRVSLRNPRWRPSSVLAGGASGSEASAARGRRRRSAAHQGGECAHEQTRLRAARTRHASRDVARVVSDVSVLCPRRDA
jgi:hypothetical protein